MPGPTSSTTLQRPDLGEVAYEYIADSAQQGFVGGKIMPIFPVMEKSADYPMIPIEASLKDTSVVRSPEGHYPMYDWEFETGTYTCVEYGLQGKIDDSERVDYDRYFDLEVETTEIITEQLMRAHEKRVAALVFASANSDVSTEWSTITANPLADVTTAKQAMRASGGLIPNVGVCSLKVFENLCNVTKVQEALQYTNPLQLGNFEMKVRTVSMYLGLDDIFVGGAVYDSAKKGQSKSIADIWDDEYFGLLRVSRGGQRLREPVFGRSMLWTEETPDMGRGITTEMYRDDSVRADIVRVRQYIDEAVIFAGAKYVLGNITA